MDLKLAQPGTCCDDSRAPPKLISREDAKFHFVNPLLPQGGGGGEIASPSLLSVIPYGLGQSLTEHLAFIPICAWIWHMCISCVCVHMNLCPCVFLIRRKSYDFHLRSAIEFVKLVPNHPKYGTQ